MELQTTGGKLSSVNTPLPGMAHPTYILYSGLFTRLYPQYTIVSMYTRFKIPSQDQLPQRNTVSTCFLIGSDNQLSGQSFLFFLPPLVQPQQQLPNVLAECKIYDREFRFCNSHQEGTEESIRSVFKLLVSLMKLQGFFNHTEKT